MMLILVQRTLKRIATANGVDLEKAIGDKKVPIWKAFAKNQFLVLVYRYTTCYWPECILTLMVG